MDYARVFATFLIAVVLLRAAEIRLSSATKLDSKSAAAAEEVGRWLTGPLLGYIVEEILIPTDGLKESCHNEQAEKLMPRAACERTLSVRAVLGVPEASHYSVPIDLPVRAARVVFAPGHTWAVVFPDDGAAPLAWAPESGILGFLDQVTAQPDSLAFSPSGVQVSFYWRNGKRLLVYSVRPEGVAILRQDASLPWPDDLDRLAISDDGTAMAATTVSGRLVHVADSIPFMVPIYASEGLGDLSFRSNKRDLMVVDRAAESLLLFEQLGGNYTSRIVLSANDGLAAPEFVTATEDGLILISSRQRQRVWAVYPDARTLRVNDVPVNRRFEKLRLRGTFLMSAESEQPGWIYQSTTDGPKVTFVPAVQQANAEK